MRKLILYSQPECHLCDEAENLMRAAGFGDTYLKIDISADPELLMHYEIHVPVLQRADDQKQLFWPFGQEELVSFVQVGS